MVDTFSKWVCILTLSAFPFKNAFGQNQATDIFLPADIVDFDYPSNEKGKIISQEEIFKIMDKSALFNNKSNSSEYVFNIIHQYILNKKDTITASSLMKIKIKNNRKTFFIDIQSHKKSNCCENDELYFFKTYFPVSYDRYFYALEMSPNVEEIKKENLKQFSGSALNRIPGFYATKDYDNGNLKKETVFFTFQKDMSSRYQKNFIYNEMSNYKDLVVREGIFHDKSKPYFYRYIYRTCKVDDIDIEEIVVLYDVRPIKENDFREKSSWFKVPGSMYEYSTIFTISITDKSIAKKEDGPKVKIGKRKF